jgi:hypothetical protein
MDDCLASRGTWMRDPNLFELLYNGRHKQITYLLTMQYPLGITPELRTNFDYVFLLADDYISNMKKLHDHYAGMFPTLDAFRQVFRELTAGFGAMVIKNRGSRHSLIDKIGYFKAENLDDVKFEFGCKQFKKYHKMNYDENWEDKKMQAEFDCDDVFAESKKNKTKINVRKIKDFE